MKAQKLAWMREKIEETRNDPRLSIPADEVFDRLTAKYQRMVDGKED